MKFYDLNEDDQLKVIAHIRKSGDMDNWYESTVDLKKPLKDIICDAMAAAVADAITRIDVWKSADGKLSLGLSDYDLNTEWVEIEQPTADDEPDKWNFKSVQWDFMPENE